MKQPTLRFDEAIDELNEFLADKKSSITFKEYQQPQFSIIALTFNKAHWTLQFLKSLVMSELQNCEIILVDNNSTDETLELLSRVHGAKIIRNSKNNFYAGGCNQGASAARGEFLLFLNNDLIVDKDFVANLYDVYLHFEKVGIVGGKLIHADGCLQEAGNIVWQDGTPLSYGRGDNPNKFSYNFVRHVDYCSAAMAMIKKELFIALGGFDTIYEPAYFEDTDLAMKVAEQGLRSYYTPFATAIHVEHGSSNLEAVVNLMSKNQRKFYLRWKDVLQRKHLPRKTDMFTSRESGNRKKILYVDNRVPVPESGGGYPRAFEFLNTVIEEKHQITLFPLKKDQVDTSVWSKSVEFLRRRGVEVVDGQVRFQDFCRERAAYYDLIIVSRYAVLDKVFLDIKSLLPLVPIVFDSEAVDFLRQELRAQFAKDLPAEIIEDTKNKELTYLKIVDFIFFVSANDRDSVVRLEPKLSERSSVLGHSLSLEPGNFEFSLRKNFLFLGGFLGNTGLNEHAVQYFVNEAWAEIHNSTHACFNIAGTNMPEEICKLRSTSINILGFVEDLNALFNETRVFVVPHQFCGGISFKLSTALSKGVPSLVSEIIAEQMGLKDGQGVLICRNAQDFVEKAKLLYSDEALWNRVRLNGLEFIKESHDPQTWKLTIIKVLNRFLNTN